VTTVTVGYDSAQTTTITGIMFGALQEAQYWAYVYGLSHDEVMAAARRDTFTDDNCALVFPDIHQWFTDRDLDIQDHITSWRVSYITFDFGDDADLALMFKLTFGGK
jgi:hypothetical protein